MLNKELIMFDGTRIYPMWLSAEDKRALKNRMGDRREWMWCGCRQDCKLWYTISSNLHLYPEHKGYAHMPGCMYAENAKDRSRFAFVQDGASGETRAFLNFKPSTFTVPYEATDTGEEREAGSGSSKDDFKYFSLERFVRQLNIDTWNERMAAGKGVLSADYFATALFGRLKNIVIDGCVKSLREYKVDTDGWGFFYQEFSGYEMKLKPDGKFSCSLTVKGNDGKTYSWFIYEKTLSVALKRFLKMFGADPKEMMSNTRIIMSGFRYQRTSKKSVQPYKVVGRLCFYAVTFSGLIARSAAELESLENISKLLRIKKDDDLKYFISDEGENYYGYFEKKGDPRKFIITGVENSYPGAVVHITDILENAITLDHLKAFLGLL